MLLYRPLTDSTNGEATSSGGQQRTNFEQRFTQLSVDRLGSGNEPSIIDLLSLSMESFGSLNRISRLDDRTRFRVLWSGAQTLSPLDIKRLLTCMAALIMPAEGVDENLESTRDILQFYREQAHYENTPSLEAVPTPLTAMVGEVKQRSPMVLVDC